MKRGTFFTRDVTGYMLQGNSRVRALQPVT